MADALVLRDVNKLLMTAETCDLVVAQIPEAVPVADGVSVGWDVGGLRLEVLTEDGLREKAKDATPYRPGMLDQTAVLAAFNSLVGKIGGHPAPRQQAALDHARRPKGVQEATRRQRQMERLAAKRAGGARG